jgi:hypothetical protein
MRDWTVKQVQSAGPGRHRVSASLYLLVASEGQGKRWIFRYTKPSTGRVTETGLGSADVVTLAEARTKAHDYRRMVAKGQDPVDAKRDARPAVTFAALANEYLDIQDKRFRNPNSTRNIRHYLLTLAVDLADKPIADIGSAHVAATLRPLWLAKPEQAKRATATVLRVLKFAKAKGLTTTSAADIREDMTHLQPRVRREARHFTAMNYTDLPAFMRVLRERQAPGD